MRRSKRRRLCKERRRGWRIDVMVQWLQVAVGILPLIHTPEKED